MFCTNCGKKIPDEGLFCVACGAPAPEDDPALGAPETAPADPGFDWVADLLEDHPSRPDPVRPAPRRRRKKKRFPVALTAVLVLLILGAAVLGISALRNRKPDPISLSEHIGDVDWSFASIKQLKKGETVLKAETDDDAAAMSVWEAIADLPLTPIEDDWAEQTLTDRGIYLDMAGGDFLLDVHVSKDGALRIRWVRPEGGETLCCEDAAAVYEALEAFLPREDTLPLSAVISETGWAFLSILHMDEQGKVIRSAILVDPDEIRGFVDLLREIEPQTGAGFRLEEKEHIYLFLVGESGTKDVSIQILSDGCGDIPMGAWEYGICHENLFLILRDMVYIY